MQFDLLASVVTQAYPNAVLKSAARLTGGVSADVYRLDVQPESGGQFSVVLRAHGASHSGHTAELEYQLLGALHRGGLPVAKPVSFDASCSALPVPFLLLDFVVGTSTMPAALAPQRVEIMAELLWRIHEFPTPTLPGLPARVDPLPEVFDYIPHSRDWDALRVQLRACENTKYLGQPKLLHGDFWPGNLLWHNDTVVAVLDWEDAAIGDPLSDVAAARLELRYKFGTAGMQGFTTSYAHRHPLDPQRLALWQVYVAAAAQRFMDGWGLPESQLEHMRKQAFASMHDAERVLSRL